MDQNTDLIHQAFAMVLFCIAVTILLITQKNYISTLNYAKDIRKDDIMYEQYKGNKDMITTRGDMITMLTSSLDYDIEIDGYFISKFENVKENIPLYRLDYEEYIKSYAYDSKGNITRIIFKGL